MKKFVIATLLLLFASPLFATEDYLHQGAKHLTAGNYDKAVRSYELAIKKKQDSAEAYKGIGLAYYNWGNYEAAYDVEMISAAVDAFNRSLAIKQDAELYYFLGLSYLALYDKKNAESAHMSLKSLDPFLADKLAKKISAYVKPAKFTYTHSTTPRSDFTSVVIEGNRVLVPVTFSYRGNSVNAMLLLDTGASVTTISEKLAAQLGVDSTDTAAATVTVADGRNVGARWFVTDSLMVGPKNLPQVQTAILTGSGGAGHDGLLGMNFLKNFRYHVDFRRNVIDWNSR
ncbi:MAG: hypothetical protein A2075_20760 [Geobacteraceae bacterium GWC2_58_44]|nr:MAG: hypothetical protein A2075_20760 [Geobacteraceae bacterium GWC2_58_44]HBG05289.1 hypothetical protein [Geobacter sp.]